MIVKVSLSDAHKTIKEYENLGYLHIGTVQNIDGVTLNFRDPITPKETLIKMSNTNSTITSTTPRVFLFKTDLSFDEAEKVGEWIYKNIKKGVLVIPEYVEFIGVEDLFKTEKIE